MKRRDFFTEYWWWGGVGVRWPGPPGRSLETGARVSLKFIAEVEDPNRRSFDYDWRKIRADLRAG